MAICVGIGGGTGAGKTTLAHAIAARLPGQVAILEHDWYYRDQRQLPLLERAHVNYDHPGALETDLLATQLKCLLTGSPVEAPCYDYKQHTRSDGTHRVDPRPVLIVEGIHVLGFPALRELMNLRIFVDVGADVRFIRRLQRDLHERGRDPDSVIRQYLEQVRPLHLAMVEPTKAYADIVVPDESNDWGIDMILAAIQSRLRDGG